MSRVHILSLSGVKRRVQFAKRTIYFLPSQPLIRKLNLPFTRENERIQILTSKYEPRLEGERSKQIQSHLGQSYETEKSHWWLWKAPHMRTLQTCPL